MTEAQTNTPSKPDRDPARLYAMLGEFENVDTLLEAAKAVRRAGYTRWEAYSPFPVHGLDRAIGQRPTRLPWIVLFLGLGGTLGGLFMTWYTNATHFDVPSWLRGYPFVISGKPIFSLPANIPVIFETTVLMAGVGAFLAMLVLNRLPRLYNPLFTSERFRRVTSDRFFIAIERADPKFERARTAELLLAVGAAHVEEVEDQD